MLLPPPIALAVVLGGGSSVYLFTNTSLPGDLTNNGFVDFEDLTILLANWNKPGATPAEGNLVDATTTPVNFEDLTVLLADWTGPGPAGSPEADLGAETVPEPSSLVIAVLAALGLSVRWRRRRPAEETITARGEPKREAGACSRL